MCIRDRGNIGRDSAAMAAGSVASRILGVVRQSLITLAIGLSLIHISEPTRPY